MEQVLINGQYIDILCDIRQYMKNEDKLLLAVGVVTLTITIMLVLGDAVVSYLIRM